VAGTTGIEWCDATFNPWWGCEKVSPACAHCYADTLSKRYANGVQLWGDGHEFRFFGDKHWAEPLKWARLLPAKLGRRPRVFCASMADVFEERDELIEARQRLFQLIRKTPELDWLLLTKRPEFAKRWIEDYYAWPASHLQPPHNVVMDPLPNVWMGVSIENARYTWRADVLREIPAAVRFISAEPLLGSLFDYDRRSDDDGNAGARELPERGRDVRGAGLQPPASGAGSQRTVHAPVGSSGLGVLHRAPIRAPLDLSGIDWVIAGGESGPRARPSHPDWFRELRDETFCLECVSESGFDPSCDRCHGTGRLVAFFFKQWGEWAPGALPLSLNGRPIGPQVTHVAVKSGRGYSSVMARLGKRNAGRELDGRVWDEFPQSAAVPA
jgi:protein gp37